MRRWRSWWNPLRGPCMILYRSLDAYRKIFLIEGPSLTIFWNSRIWYEVLISRHGDIALLLVPKQVPPAAVTIMFTLICCCSIATVTAACIWHIGSYPPTLFGVSCRCNDGFVSKRNGNFPGREAITNSWVRGRSVESHFFLPSFNYFFGLMVNPSLSIFVWKGGCPFLL